MKIQLYRPYELGSLKKSEKPQGVEIIHGKYCRECWCKDYYRCKRRTKFRWHNFCVDMKRKFGFRIPIHIHPEIEENLSGTILCPKSKARIYSCWDCIYACRGRECNCKERFEEIKNGTYDYSSREGKICNHFFANDFAKRYSRQTGKILWDK